MTDQLWLLICSGLVLLMQAGFMCLESGLTRSKNSINVAVKNLSDFGVSVLLFWGLGYGLMFGLSQGSLIGVTNFFFDGTKIPAPPHFSFFKPCFAALPPRLFLGRSPSV